MERIKVSDIFEACRSGRLRAFTDGPGVWIEDTETHEAVMLAGGQTQVVPEQRKSQVERMFGNRESWGGQEHEGNPATAQRGGCHGERTSKGAQRMPGERRSEWSGLCEDDEQGPYKGFLLVVCEECGAVKAFCAKRETYGFRCDQCGHETPLEHLRPLYMHCKCGKSFRYKTNARTETITHACLDCKAPVDMELNKKGTAYVTIGVRKGQA